MAVVEVMAADMVAAVTDDSRTAASVLPHTAVDLTSSEGAGVALPLRHPNDAMTDCFLFQ